LTTRLAAAPDDRSATAEEHVDGDLASPVEASETAAEQANRAGSVSPATAASRAFVEAHLPEAQRLGRDLADLLDDPDAFATALRTGLERLGDEAYRTGQPFIAPGLQAGHSIGVRLPLLRAVISGLRRASRSASPDTLLWAGDRLLHNAPLEVRLIAFELLEQVLPSDPERTWQVLRRAAREAHEWITVDSLAQAYGAGILLEERRWAEIEMLEYSASRWERRLVGSTIATMTHVDRRRGRDPLVAVHALPLVASLMGDAEPDVQKALAWAYRSLTVVDRPATEQALREQTEQAARDDDGHRAWVIRDTLAKLDPATADELRSRLAGIRRRPGAPATSAASETAARFGSLPDPTLYPEPPLR
jgi:3-methyladenine DNA glycosylase AlkD